MFSLIDFIPRAIVQSIPLLLGCVGETLNEKSGSLNLGIPGVMYVGAISGVIGSFLYENSGSAFNPLVGVLIPLIACLFGSLMMGLIFCFLTVTLRANQNVTGLAMTTFGVGFGNFFGGSIMKLTGSDVPSIALTATSKAFKTGFPVSMQGSAAGQLLLSYGFMTYVAILIALVTNYILKRTRTGLELRAVGENPATADAAGININRYKYFSVCIGCMIAGLGGLYYVMDYANGVWSNDAFGDRGWIAIALVIFCIWRPNVAILESILFGGLLILYLYLPTGTNFATKELYKMIPYIVTIVVLILISIRNKKDSQPPEALGLPYFREDR